MAQIVIRNLDEAVVHALRRAAAASGVSMEEQARRALTRAVGLDREEAVRRLVEFRDRIGRIPGPSVVEMLRRDRDRDDQ
jgi:plasmid stability protein